MNDTPIPIPLSPFFQTRFYGALLNDYKHQNPLKIPAGEELPPINQILEAARQEALELERFRRLAKTRVFHRTITPKINFIGRESNFNSKFKDHLDKARYEYEVFESSEQALNTMERHLPDLVLVDSLVHDSSAPEVFKRVSRNFPSIPVVIFLEKPEASQVVELYRLGVSEILLEPFEPWLLASSIVQILNKAAESKVQDDYLSNLERIIDERTDQLVGYMGALKQSTEKLSLAYHDVVERLGRTAQWRDDETGDHIARIGLFAGVVSKYLGLSNYEIDLISRAAPLHDIGKIGVPDSILLKPGPLSSFEYEYMKTHTLIGAEILSGSDDPLLKASEQIALSHHEWYDGNGYPMKKKGDDIPLFGRIVAVVDVFDAMLHERTYKKAFTLEDTLKEMKERSGTQFDPSIFQAFLESIDELVDIERKIGREHDSDTKYNVRFGLHRMTKHLEETWHGGGKKKRAKAEKR